MEQTPPKPRISLHDIARRLNVSQPTVSRALKDDPRISIATRERVQRVAREMGYQPDPMLTALAHYRRGKTQTPVSSALAWINRWTKPEQLRRHQEFELYWKGATQEAERCGYRLEEFVCDERLPLPRLEKILLTRNIRGILIPPHLSCPDWGDFDWAQFCVVRFGHSIDTPRAHLVTSDQLTDSLMAFQHILKMGYRRIGFVAADQPHIRFKAGYLFAQLTLDLKQRLPLLDLTDPNSEEGKRRLASWLKQVQPDAILTDVAPLRDMLSKLRWRVPEDVGLAALSVLDGNADAGIYQNSAEIGRAAVQLVISLIHHNERGVPEVCRELLVEGQWVDGQTLPTRNGKR